MKNFYKSLPKQNKTKPNLIEKWVKIWTDIAKTEYPNGQLISLKALNLINLQGNTNKPTMRYK